MGSSSQLSGTVVETLEQDNQALIVSYYFYKELNAVVCQSALTKGQRIISLNADHGFIAPSNYEDNYINIHYKDATRHLTYLFQTKIIAVNGSSVTLQFPVPFDIALENVERAYRVNTNLASTLYTSTPDINTPDVYKLDPSPSGSVWDITSTITTMITETQPNDSLFGDQIGLLYGLIFGKVSSTMDSFLVGISDNGSLADLGATLEYSTRTTPSTGFGIRSIKSWNGSDNNGTAIRVNGLKGEALEGRIHENITAIKRLRVGAIGHYATVQEPITPSTVLTDEDSWEKVGDEVYQLSIVFGTAPYGPYTAYRVITLPHGQEFTGDEPFTVFHPSEIYQIRGDILKDVYVQAINNSGKLLIGLF